MPADASETARMELESDVAWYTAAMALQVEKILKSAWDDIVDNWNALSLKAVEPSPYHEMAVSRRRSQIVINSHSTEEGIKGWARIVWPMYSGVGFDVNNPTFGSSFGKILFPPDDQPIDKLDEMADMWLKSVFCDGFVRLFLLASKPEAEGGSTSMLVLACRTLLEMGPLKMNEVFRMMLAFHTSQSYVSIMCFDFILVAYRTPAHLMVTFSIYACSLCYHASALPPYLR